ncbi:protein DBF4 homolog B isoform X2 [Mixophyes fleayi]|uniref:protein DBF4 homolog B isoform X2 n=1 Tax=Mixophyes fleayi TaxID=3061075 RepID=UPI003F4DA394
MATLNPMADGCHLHQERGVILDRRKSITISGKVFYLDLPHSKQTQLLAKAIYKMGGVIEGFLSKDVDYMVTRNRKAAVIVNGDLGDRREGRLERQTAKKMETTPCSRGKQLLKKVIQNQECSSVLSSARSWGVCILHVDEVLDYLMLPTHRSKKTTEESGSDCRRRTLKIGKLKRPFLKIEDQSRKYRPLQCSFSSFPEFSFISSDRSPFETACTNSTPKERDPGEQEDDEVERSKRPHVREKSGYCECCQVAYTKLSEHLISEQHCFFALDAANYRAIDNLTSHIICDLMELPYKSKSAERHIGNVPCSIKELPLSGAEHPVEEEHKLALPKILLLGNGATHPVGAYDECLLEGPPLGNIEASFAEEHKVGFLENLPVETSVGLWWEKDTANEQIHCKAPIAMSCEAGAGSHVGHVTEVSWYTDETGLTSVYTVQSVVKPPAQVIDENTELDTPGQLCPQLFLNNLLDPLSALAMDGFEELHNKPTQREGVSATDADPQMIHSAAHHCTELLADEPPLVAGGELCKKLCAGSPSEKLCTNMSSLQPLDTVAQQSLENESDGGVSVISIIDSAVDVHQGLLLTDVQNEPLLNAPCGLHTELSNSLSLDQPQPTPLLQTLADHELVTPSSAFPGNLIGPHDQEQQLVNTDWFRVKRKHCWSPCHPPAKRQPFQCQPVWDFRQLPSTGQLPPVSVSTDCIGKNCNKITEGTATVPTSCFNPKLAQYNASSGSDWDSQFLSPQQNIPQQNIHYGDLRTAQINLDKSRYAKQLCSVLAHDKSLGSPTTTQTVTLSYTSYELNVHEVAS